MSANIKGGLLGEAADEDLVSFASEQVSYGEGENPEDESNGFQAPPTDDRNTDDDSDLFALFRDDTDTTEEVETPPVTPVQEDELSPEAIAQIAKKYRNDPAEMAKALAHAQRKITEQGTRLGQQQSQQQQQFETFTINTDKTFDPLLDAVDEETGWPVDAEGNTYTPKNALGIEFIPDSRLAVLQKLLSEKHGTNHIAAQQEYGRIIAGDNQRMAAEFAEQERKFLPAQVPIANREIAAIAEDLAFDFEKPVADEIAKRIKNLAMDAAPKAFASGVLSDVQYFDKNTLAQAARAIYQGLTSKQKREAAAEIKAELAAKAGTQATNPLTTNNGKKPQVRTQVPARPSSNGAAPRQESNGLRTRSEPDYSVKKMEFDLD